MIAEKPLIRPTRLVYGASAVPAPGGVTLAGFIRHSGGVPGSERVFGRYAVVLVIDGGGTYRDARGANLPVRVGDLIFVFPELGHWYGPQAGQTWSEFYIVFDGPAFDAWRGRTLLDSARPIVHLSPTDYWLGRMETILEPPSDLTKLCRMQQFIADVFEHDRAAAAGPTHADAWLPTAKSLLTATVTDPPLHPEEVAQRVGMSYEVFRKRFAKLTGLAPAKFRDAGLIDLASELLKDRRQSLREIAQRCGFCDEFHFSRRFKQKIGLPPSEFRERLP